jgi:hypothetical protein
VAYERVGREHAECVRDERRRNDDGDQHDEHDRREPEAA